MRDQAADELCAYVRQEEQGAEREAQSWRREVLIGTDEARYCAWLQKRAGDFGLFGVSEKPYFPTRMGTHREGTRRVSFSARFDYTTTQGDGILGTWTTPVIEVVVMELTPASALVEMRCNLPKHYAHVFTRLVDETYALFRGTDRLGLALVGVGVEVTTPPTATDEAGREPARGRSAGVISDAEAPSEITPRVPTLPKVLVRWRATWAAIQRQWERGTSYAEMERWLGKMHPDLCVGEKTLRNICAAGEAGLLD